MAVCRDGAGNTSRRRLLLHGAHRLRSTSTMTSQHEGVSWFTLCGFAFLTLNSALAIYRSQGDVGAIAFVVCIYPALVLLFCCLRRYEMALHGSPQRDRLEASVWGLTTMLTLSFAYVVMRTAGLTLPMALHAWVIAAATGIGAFYAFFEQDRGGAGNTSRRRLLLHGAHRLRTTSTMTSQQPRPNPYVRVAPRHEDVGFSWLTFVGFAFLTFNTTMAIYHSKDDNVAATSFVIVCYFDVVLLFYCLRWLEKAPHGSPQRDRLKASVWGLTTMLTLSFAYVVMRTAALTLPMALLIWAIAAATGIGAFYAFFEQDRLNPQPDEAMLHLV